MSTLTVRLPDSLHDKLKELAKAEGVSINQFMVLAAAGKNVGSGDRGFFTRKNEKRKPRKIEEDADEGAGCEA